MRRLAVLCSMLALAGCGSTESDPLEAPPTPATSFEFSKADIMRPTPRDICRQKDADFAIRLMGRVDAALPIEAKGTAQLDRFLVQNRFDGKGKEAVLWFTAHRAGKNGVMMFATGPFDPRTCEIGELSASVGTDLYRDVGNDGFAIL